VYPGFLLLLPENQRRSRAASGAEGKTIGTS